MRANLVEQFGAEASDIGQVLLSPEQLRARVQELAQEISTDYQERSPVLVGVLKGVVYFMTDLTRGMTIPLEMDWMAVSSYSAESRKRGLVRLIKDLDGAIIGRHVLFVEDVIDTGLTLNYLLRNLELRKPASLQVCVLFNKPRHRLIDIPIRYKGFDLPDQLVVGYGLDYRERYRELPFVGLLKAQAFEK